MKQLIVILTFMASTCISDSECSADIMNWSVTATDGIILPPPSTADIPSFVLALGAVQAQYGEFSNILTITSFTSQIPNFWTFDVTQFTPGITGVTSVTQLSKPLGSVDADVRDSLGPTYFEIDTTASIAGTWQFGVTFSSATAAVPEPSSVAMLCTLGLGGVWVRRRRQSVA